MKRVIIVLMMVIVGSCMPSYHKKEEIDPIPKVELQWNYELIDRIVNNPDSLYFFLNSDEYSKMHYPSIHVDKESERNKLAKMVINKLIENDFKSGYTITEEKLEKHTGYHTYLTHSLYIKSNKTDKRVFLKFNCNRNWYLNDIHTIILGKDRIIEY